MMNKVLIIIIFAMLWSCSDHKRLSQTIKGDTFVNEPGTYNLNNGKLMVRKFEDGTLVYGVADKFNKVQHQQSIFQPFSDDQFWTIYIDKEENIWFYSSDLQQLEELKFDSDKNEYVLREIASETILPRPFVKKLDDSGVSGDDMFRMKR